MVIFSRSLGRVKQSESSFRVWQQVAHEDWMTTRELSGQGDHRPDPDDAQGEAPSLSIERWSHTPAG